MLTNVEPHLHVCSLDMANWPSLLLYAC